MGAVYTVTNFGNARRVPKSKPPIRPEIFGRRVICAIEYFCNQNNGPTEDVLLAPDSGGISEPSRAWVWVHGEGVSEILLCRKEGALLQQLPDR